MIFRKPLTPHYVMGALIALLLAVTGASGVVTRGQIYAPFLSDLLVAFQFFQDLLSLLLAPCLIAAMWLVRRGSLRALSIWTGILLYAAYYYVFYAVGAVLTVFYPAYIALIGLAAYSLSGLLLSVDAQAFARQVDGRMPVRFIALVLGMTLLFVPIWLLMMAQSIATGNRPEAYLVWVLDLAFLIPACVYTAAEVWRRSPTGLLLAGPLLLKAALSGVLLLGGELLKGRLGYPPATDQMAMYAFLALVGSTALGFYLRSVTGDAGAAATREVVPAR